MPTDYDAVIEHTKTLWEFGKPIPTPKGAWVSCGICSSPDYILRNARWFKRPPEQTGYNLRVDVSLKCTNCGFAWVHGLVPEEDEWLYWVGQQRRKGGAKYNRYELEQDE